MPDFTAKMHQIQFRLGPPQTPLGELTALHQTFQLHLTGPTFKGGKGRVGEWED